MLRVPTDDYRIIELETDRFAIAKFVITGHGLYDYQLAYQTVEDGFIADDIVRTGDKNIVVLNSTFYPVKIYASKDAAIEGININYNMECEELEKSHSYSTVYKPKRNTTKPKLVVEAVNEYWGERCPDFEPECHTCKAWQEYDSMIEEMERQVKRNEN